MKLKYLFLLTILLYGYQPTVAQSRDVIEQDRIAREQAVRDAETRRSQENGFARLAAIKAAAQENVQLIRRNGDVYFKYKPALTEGDIRAVSVHPADLIQYKNFLKQANTGIVRLQNADVCLPQNQVIQAVGACPNNISGKATSYSFRTSDYRSKNFSDIFFSKNAFSSVGAFTLGIFSNLGDTEIENLTLASAGVNQLADFEPSANESEIDKQVYLLKKGVEIGGNIYKTLMPATENHSYVLRTIAYKGRIMRNSAPNRINILDEDERKDVLLVFRIIRKHEDGSLTLLYKELSRKAVPKVVLEEKS